MIGLLLHAHVLAAVIGLLLLALVIVMAIVVKVAKDLVSEEIRGRLELVPVALLRLVAARIPADQREDLYEREWLPDLLHILRNAEGRPITRLVVGIWYSVSLFRSARTEARDLRNLSDGEEAAAVNIPPAHVQAKAGVAGGTSGATGAVVLRGSGTLSAGGTSVTRSAAHGSIGGSITLVGGTSVTRSAAHGG